MPARRGDLQAAFLMVALTPIKIACADLKPSRTWPHTAAIRGLSRMDPEPPHEGKILTF
jgi:hypothetical protein